MKLVSQSNQVFSFDFEQSITFGVKFTARSTLIQLKNREMLVISPGPFNEEALSQIKSMADKFYVVAPNLFHHFYFLAAKESLPNSELYGPMALGKKVKALKSQFTDIEQLPKHVKDQVTVIPIRGNRFLQERVFFHPESKTLVVTDLVFNMNKRNFFTSLILKMAGAHNKLAQSRLVKSTVSDLRQFHEDISNLQKFPCERLIMAHGEVLTDMSQWHEFLQRHQRQES